MPTRSPSSIIYVTDAAKLASLGPRRFRQRAGLEHSSGKEYLELAYVGGRAVINRAKAMEVIARISAERRQTAIPRHVHLGRFTEPCEVDPETGERLCIEDGCRAAARGRGKLCASHRAARAAARAARRSRRPAAQTRP